MNKTWVDEFDEIISQFGEFTDSIEDKNDSHIDLFAELFLDKLFLFVRKHKKLGVEKCPVCDNTILYSNKYCTHCAAVLEPILPSKPYKEIDCFFTENGELISEAELDMLLNESEKRHKDESGEILSESEKEYYEKAYGKLL